LRISAASRRVSRRCEQENAKSVCVPGISKLKLYSNKEKTKWNQEISIHNQKQQT